MLHTIKTFTHHAEIPEGPLRVVPSKGGKAFLIVAANGQAIAETVPTQNPKKGMARAALLAHSFNSVPVLLKAGEQCSLYEDITAWDAAVKQAEDLSKIGV